MVEKTQGYTYCNQAVTLTARLYIYCILSYFVCVSVNTFLQLPYVLSKNSIKNNLILYFGSLKRIRSSTVLVSGLFDWVIVRRGREEF